MNGYRQHPIEKLRPFYASIALGRMHRANQNIIITSTKSISEESSNKFFIYYIFYLRAVAVQPIAWMAKFILGVICYRQQPPASPFSYSIGIWSAHNTMLLRHALLAYFCLAGCRGGSHSLTSAFCFVVSRPSLGYRCSWNQCTAWKKGQNWRMSKKLTIEVTLYKNDHSFILEIW